MSLSSIVNHKPIVKCLINFLEAHDVFILCMLNKSWKHRMQPLLSNIKHSPIYAFWINISNRWFIRYCAHNFEKAIWQILKQNNIDVVSELIKTKPIVYWKQIQTNIITDLKNARSFVFNTDSIDYPKAILPHCPFKPYVFFKKNRDLSLKTIFIGFSYKYAKFIADTNVF